jgi:hypothetical protein
MHAGLIRDQWFQADPNPGMPMSDSRLKSRTNFFLGIPAFTSSTTAAIILFCLLKTSSHPFLALTQPPVAPENVQPLILSSYLAVWSSRQRPASASHS